MTESTKTRKHPSIGSGKGGAVVGEKRLVKEKAATRARDGLAAERRQLPMVLIDKEYFFDGPDGRASLGDLFEGKRQLLIYHFMFDPGVHGWPTAGCDGCSMVVDQIGHPAHLHARDVNFVLVSHAPFPQIQPYQKRMGWTLPWFSSYGSDFNRDFGITTPAGEGFGLSVFLRDGKKVYRTYFDDSVGAEALGTVCTFLDLTPFGRREA